MLRVLRPRVRFLQNVLVAIVAFSLGAAAVAQAVTPGGITGIVRLADGTVDTQIAAVDASGNVAVKVSNFPATQQVNINGVVTTQPAAPAHTFSLLGTFVIGNPALDGCEQNLPAGTKWFISSLAGWNSDAATHSASLVLIAPGLSSIPGPIIAVPPHASGELTFPQPFVLTSTGDGYCLKLAADGSILYMVVGYRQ